MKKSPSRFSYVAYNFDFREFFFKKTEFFIFL